MSFFFSRIVIIIITAANFTNTLQDSGTFSTYSDMYMVVVSDVLALTDYKSASKSAALALTTRVRHTVPSHLFVSGRAKFLSVLMPIVLLQVYDFPTHACILFPSHIFF